MYYFAYSSNMNFDHMRRLCGWHFTVQGVAVLKDYEFGPDTRGYANVRPQSGKNVLGVLYEVDQHCIDALDEIEGYPEIFNRLEVSVEDKSGQKKTAWAYIEPAEKFGGTFIKQDFMRRVVVGAQQNNLPEEWIKFLNSFCD
jgi:gamma-glutamylcyclotransferase (GGCT)/AIG2-like uncharacterized protein YtfP